LAEGTTESSRCRRRSSIAPLSVLRTRISELERVNYILNHRLIH